MDEMTIWWILEKSLMGVASEVERGSIYQEKMSGLVKVN